MLIAPAFTTIKGGTDVTSAAYTIKGVLDTARTYAKANNTYTWVGFKEVDVSQDASVSPQASAGTGRVAMAIVASKDGTRGYDITSNPLPIPSAWTNYNNGANLVAVGKLQYLNNVHLAGALTTAGNMARPNVSSNNYIIGTRPSICYSLRLAAGICVKRRTIFVPKGNQFRSTRRGQNPVFNQYRLPYHPIRKLTYSRRTVPRLTPTTPMWLPFSLAA